jgi:hypothetical protein
MGLHQLEVLHIMTKKHFIALADAIRAYNKGAFPSGTNTVSPLKFTHTQVQCLADFCKSQNFRFDRSWWISYIAGECGPNGGAIRESK